MPLWRHRKKRNAESTDEAQSSPAYDRIEDASEPGYRRVLVTTSDGRPVAYQIPSEPLALGVDAIAEGAMGPR
jgi:hypothetical protein